MSISILNLCEPLMIKQSPSNVSNLSAQLEAENLVTLMQSERPKRKELVENDSLICKISPIFFKFNGPLVLWYCVSSKAHFFQRNCAITFKENGQRTE